MSMKRQSGRLLGRLSNGCKISVADDRAATDPLIRHKEKSHVANAPLALGVELIHRSSVSRTPL